MLRKGLMVISGAAALALSAAASGEILYSLTESQDVSTTEFVTPYIINKTNTEKPNQNNPNRSCGDVGAAFYGNATYFECRSDKKDYPFDSGTEFVSNDPANTECANTITVNTAGTYVDWASTSGVGAAIVKGSADANVYVYDPQKQADTGLTSPYNASEGPAGLSNLTFCWNPDDDEQRPCYKDETAWAAGTRYNTRGNWATYTKYEENKIAKLFAGQTIDAGSVKFEPENGSVKITVTLNDGFRFRLEVDDVDADGNDVYDNNIKVQPYDSKPSGNPSPGLFGYKTVATSSPASIIVPAAKFYGVHVDVEREVPCPEPVAADTGG